MTFTLRPLADPRKPGLDMRYLERPPHRLGQRWGRRGDKQDGIDLKGKWTDGRSAVWQCNGIQPFRQQM